MYNQELKRALFSILTEKGAKLMGVADLSGIVNGEMQTGVSVAVPVPVNIVKDLRTAPTKEYYDAYHALNAKLDDIVSGDALGEIIDALIAEDQARRLSELE